MTKCDDMMELIPEYPDLPENDPNRIRVDEHILQCDACREQLEFWLESSALIQSAALAAPEPVPERVSFADSVMQRIYSEEGWRMPVAERLYRIPYRLRIRLLTLVAACFALFGCGMLYRLIPPGTLFGQSPKYEVMSFQPGEASGFAITGLEGVPVASIGDPVILGLTVTQSYPDYLLAFSLIGIISALLTMNWLSRIRS